MNNNEGPQLINIPSRRYSSCNGCKWFKTKGVVFGPNFRENQTSCSHPDFKDERDFLTGKKGEKMIELSTREHDNHVPDWCPVIKIKQ